MYAWKITWYDSSLNCIKTKIVTGVYLLSLVSGLSGYTDGTCFDYNVISIERVPQEII